jgi:hypothetical protein
MPVLTWRATASIGDERQAIRVDGVSAVEAVLAARARLRTLADGRDSNVRQLLRAMLCQIEFVGVAVQGADLSVDRQKAPMMTKARDDRVTVRDARHDWPGR